MTTEQYYAIDDEFAMWVEDESSIHIKTISQFGDPVELTFDQAEELARKLLDWLNKYR
jgi:hypothetical protein